MSNLFFSIILWGMGLFFLGLLGYGFFIVLTSKDEPKKQEMVRNNQTKKMVKSH